MKAPRTATLALFFGVALSAPHQGYATQIVGVYVPVQSFQTKTNIGTGTGSSEAGLGLEHSYFLSESLATLAHYELDFSLKVKSVVLSGFSGGLNYYLLGGKPTQVDSPNLNVVGWSVYGVSAGLLFGQRQFDFSAFDKTKDVALVTGTRPITTGELWGPTVTLTADMALNRAVRVGTRLQMFRSVVSDKTFTLTSYGASVLLECAL